MHLTQIINNYKSVVFDNDGVVMDSNGAKSEAFVKALEGEDILLIEEFLSYHKAFGGVSRFEKIKYFYVTIKKEKNYAAPLKKALEKYSYFSKQALLSAELMPGVENFLKLLKKHNKTVHVISGSDQKELVDVYEKRNLIQYFTKVSGSPRTKTNILKKIIKNSDISFPAIYFGDSLLDYSTASKYGLTFVYISSRSEWKKGITFCKGMKCQIEPNFLDTSKI